MRRLGWGAAGAGLAIGLAILGGFGLGRAKAADRTDLSTAQQNGQTMNAPTIQIYSRETVVDVLVTDANGQPVRGLTQADFTVKENGVEQPIRSFSEFDAGSVVASGSKLATAVFTNRGAKQLSGPVNVILLDGLNVPRGMLFAARRATVTYLKTMPAGTEIAIFALSSRGLVRLSGFTSDREALILAANRAVDWGQGHVEVWTRKWVTTQALEQIAAYVKPVKGRKNLLWFTPSMPVLLLRDGGYGWHEEEMTVVHMLMDAYELLAGAEVAVSPIDPSGVSPFMGARQLMMEQVAEESGGKAYYDTNSLSGALAEAIESGSHYYTLSYAPPRKKDDGHWHTIHVVVNRPGLNLVYRAGYNAEDPLSAKAIAPGPGLKQAVAQGKALEGADLVFDVNVEPSGDDSDARPATRMLSAHGPATPMARYNIVFSVPADEITPVAGRAAELLLFEVEAYGPTGKPVRAIAQRVQVPPLIDEHGDVVGTPFRFTQQLDLPVGQIFLEVSVVDEESKSTGRLEIPLAAANGPEPHPRP
jgi:VWFA-related protein